MPRIVLLLTLACVLVACEGPTGPTGPAGPAGPTGAPGEDAEFAITLVELSVSEAAWELSGWDDSYVFFDSRFIPSRLVEVYLKRFYFNTGGVYYQQFALWTAFAEANSGGSTSWQLFDGGIRFYDPEKRLQNETIIIAIRN